MASPTFRRAARGLCLLPGLLLLIGCSKPPQPAPMAKQPPAAQLAAPQPTPPAPSTPTDARTTVQPEPDQPAATAPAPSTPPASAPDESAATPPETPVKISDPTALRGLSDEDAALPVRKPAVLLSQQHQATCRVKPDETFPDLSLQTLDGTTTRLTEHGGQRLTVVLFWDCQHPMSVEQVSRLEQEVLKPYGGVGVGVVAVNVGDSAEALQQLLSQIDHSFVTLWDRDRRAYGQLATDMMPRTYLLDTSGRILWLDVEYSRSTRRELRNAILYHLREQLQADQQQADPLM